MLIQELVTRMIGKKVLVVGDVMLDKSIYYKTKGYSQEFDGDILVEYNRINYPGGAANVAMQCRSLGADVTLLGAFGTDQAGLRLHSGLTSALVTMPTTAWNSRTQWGTTSKTRVFVNSGFKYRIDDDKYQELDRISVAAEIRKKDFDLLLLSDYDKGMFRDSYFVLTIIEEFRKAHPNGLITVNPKPSMVKILPKVDLISLNDREYRECEPLLVREKSDWVLRTRGSRGATLHRWKSDYSTYSYEYPAIPVDQPDVVGCGDAVFAAVSLALSVYPDHHTLGKIAIAAGTAKALKEGTVRVLPDEIVKWYDEVLK